jgi:hypothetical protein
MAMYLVRIGDQEAGDIRRSVYVFTAYDFAWHGAL